MENQIELFRKAGIHRKNGQYQEAVSLYKHLWQDDSASFDQWSAWGYAYSLLKLKHYQDSLEMCRILYPRFQGFVMLRSVYAAAIYYTEFKEKQDPDLAQLKKATNAILQLTPADTPYSLAPKAVLILVKRMMAQMEIDWQEIENYLLKLNPEFLDDSVFRYTDTRGRQAEQASDVEKWYAEMIKTKAALNKPEELLQLLEVARTKDIKWHYSNDIWFKRKEAFAYFKLGNRTKADEILRNILLIKKDWFLLYDLAMVLEDTEEKFKLMCRAALSTGKPEMKLKLFESLSELCANRSEEEDISLNHLKLVIALRKENNWKISGELVRKAGLENLAQTEVLSSGKILKELIPYWKKHSGEKSPKKQEGVITKILPHGGAGFISSGKESFYFTIKNQSLKLAEGDKVSFETIESFDKKKNKNSEIAVKIKPVKNQKR